MYDQAEGDECEKECQPWQMPGQVGANNSHHGKHGGQQVDDMDCARLVVLEERQQAMVQVMPVGAHDADIRVVAMQHLVGYPAPDGQAGVKDGDAAGEDGHDNGGYRCNLGAGDDAQGAQ